jgi:hypothetical protein
VGCKPLGPCCTNKEVGGGEIRMVLESSKIKKIEFKNKQTANNMAIKGIVVIDKIKNVINLMKHDVMALKMGINGFLLRIRCSNIEWPGLHWHH